MAKKVLLSIIFIPPFVFIFLLSNLFSVKANFNIPDETDGSSLPSISISDVTKEVLSKQEERLKFLTPVINPEWFLYNVYIHNNVKIAIVSEKADPPYGEATTSISIMGDGSHYDISYGEDKTIQRNIKRKEIINLEGYRFDIFPNKNQVFPPNSILKLQHSASLGVASFNVNLSFWSKILIYIFFLIFYCGLISLARSMFQFVYFEGKWWFR